MSKKACRTGLEPYKGGLLEPWPQQVAGWHLGFEHASNTEKDALDGSLSNGYMGFCVLWAMQENPPGTVA